MKVRKREVTYEAVRFSPNAECLKQMRGMVGAPKVSDILTPSPPFRHNHAVTIFLPETGGFMNVYEGDYVVKESTTGHLFKHTEEQFNNIFEEDKG